MDDLTGFKQPAEKDWKDNLYGGPNMPPVNAQRELREPGLWASTKEFALTVFALLSPFLFLGLIALAVWDLFLR